MNKNIFESLESDSETLSKGIKAKESGDSYQLREPSAPYQIDSLARPRVTIEVNLVNNIPKVRILGHPPKPRSGIFLFERKTC